MTVAEMIILNKEQFLPKYVISLDEFDMSRNGIKHRNLRDFLLSPDWS
jgi:hypothetical protein